MEYVAMLSGDEVPRRLPDVLQARLRWLIERNRKGVFPSEGAVAQWFKLTEGQARTLLANTKARFEFESRQWTVDAIKQFLVDTKNDDSEWQDGYAPAMLKLIVPRILLPELRMKARELDSTKQFKAEGEFTLVDRDLLRRLIAAYGAAVPASWKKYKPFKE
jgi:hypothetical protein